MEDRLSDDQREKMLPFMATEHSVLQAGRSATIFETGGRTAVFLGSVSSSLIALAFIGQISRLGTAFFAFALVLLPTLFFLGLVTFERAMELGVEDVIYALGMSRIRHFYVEMVPQAEKYFIGSIHDDLSTTMAPTVFGRPVSPAELGWQSFLTMPGAIAMVNSVIAGSFAGLLVRMVRVDSLALSMGGDRSVCCERVVSSAPPDREVAPDRPAVTDALSSRAYLLGQPPRIRHFHALR